MGKRRRARPVHRRDRGRPKGEGSRLQIRPAEPIRAPRPRPSRPAPATPPVEAREGIGKLPIVVLLLVVAGAVAFALARHRREADPHLVRARKLVAAYEDGRAPDARDYEHPVYAQALAELERVDPGSVSAAEATSLAGTLRAGAEAQSARALASREAVAARQARAQDRDDRTLEMQRRNRVLADAAFAHCPTE